MTASAITPFLAIRPTAAHARTAPQAPLARWGADIKRILCIRLDNLGDVLMTGPAIAALKRASPDRHLTLLASHSGAAAAPFLPEIDEVLRFDPPWAQHDAMADAAATREWVQRLSDARFDAAVIFTVYSQSALPAAMLCYQAGIPRRLGYCRENPYALLNDWRQESEPEQTIRHEVQRQLDLVAEVAGEAENEAGADAGSEADHADHRRMRFALAPGHFLAMEAVLRISGVSTSSGWIVVHPGATAASRRYPTERFAQIAATLAERTGKVLLITGSEAERDLVRQVHVIASAMFPAGASRIVDLAGRLSLAELGAVLDRASLLVTNNSGPVHIASARGTPIVDLYAMTNPQHTPWETPHRVLFHDVYCRWCYKSRCPEGHHRCMTGIDVQHVIDQAIDLLVETGGWQPPTDETVPPVPCPSLSPL